MAVAAILVVVELFLGFALEREGEEFLLCLTFDYLYCSSHIYYFDHRYPHCWIWRCWFGGKGREWNVTPRFRV
jgi:hypothetical protein